MIPVRIDIVSLIVRHIVHKTHMYIHTVTEESEHRFVYHNNNNIIVHVRVCVCATLNTLAPSFLGLDAPVNEDKHTTFLINLL